MKGALLLLAILVVGAGCASAEEKCAAARDIAHKAWSDYAGELTAARDRARASIKASQNTLDTKVEPRIDLQAKATADRLYKPGSDEWMRGLKTALNSSCMKDAECTAVKQSMAEQQAAIDDLEERLGLAEKARDATRELAAAAQSASLAAIVDPPRPALKAAQATSVELAEECEGVPLEPEKAP